MGWYLRAQPNRLQACGCRRRTTCFRKPLRNIAKHLAGRKTQTPSKQRRSRRKVDAPDSPFCGQPSGGRPLSPCKLSVGRLGSRCRSLSKAKSHCRKPWEAYKKLLALPSLHEVGQSFAAVRHWLLTQAEAHGEVDPNVSRAADREIGEFAMSQNVVRLEVSLSWFGQGSGPYPYNRPRSTGNAVATVPGVHAHCRLLQRQNASGASDDFAGAFCKSSQPAWQQMQATSKSSKYHEPSGLLRQVVGRCQELGLRSCVGPVSLRCVLGERMGYLAPCKFATSHSSLASPWAQSQPLHLVDFPLPSPPCSGGSDARSV